MLANDGYASYANVGLLAVPATSDLVCVQLHGVGLCAVAWCSAGMFTRSTLIWAVVLHVVSAAWLLSSRCGSHQALFSSLWCFYRSL